MNREMTTPNATPAPITNRLRELGEWNPDWDPIAELNPDWTERFVAMGTKPMMSGVLDPKTVEFIAIAVDASCTHLNAPGVRRHIQKALDLGATRDEITAVAAFETALAFQAKDKRAAKSKSMRGGTP